MKALGLSLVLLVALGAGGCSKAEKALPSGATSSTSISQSGPATSAPTAVMPDVVGKKLDVALKDLKEAGVTDKPKYIGGGTFGVVDESNWTVCAQAPAPGDAATGTPQLTVDRKCGSDSTNSTVSAATPTEPSTTTTPPAEVLNASNNADFAALLLVRDTCQEVEKSFAAKYTGRTIEFDGNVAQVGGLPGTPPLDRSGARQDLMVYAGDYNVDKGILNDGPAMKFAKVNLSDLNLTGSQVPDHVGEGDNLHFVARVAEYNDVGCVFRLEPVATSLR